MFMVKGECENIMKLLRVKIKTEYKDLKWYLAIMAGVFVITIAPAVVSILQGGTPGMNFHNMTDFTTFFFFAMIIGLLIIMFLYRWANNALSVFPQTNTSRFVASEAAGYLMTTFALIVVFVMYLLQYCTILIISGFREDVFFALEFDIGFVVVGFIAYIMYFYLMIAVIGLVGAILRKWTYYAALAFATVIALGVANFNATVELLPRLFGFLVHEPSFGLFMLKAMGLWLVIAALSFVINRYTVYYKSQDMTITKKVVITGISIVAVIVSLSVVIFPYTTDTTVFSAMLELEVDREEHDADRFIRDFFAGAEEIRIDISHLTRGSNIILTTEGIADDGTAGGYFVITGRAWRAFVGGLDALHDIQGDTLVIRFRPPFYERNGIELMHFANPRLTAELDGSNLHLVYEYDTVHVVTIPVWGIARQFEMFRDRGVVSEFWLMQTGGGNMSANIHISVE